MEDKRLDLDIPLLSVRRHSVPTPVKPSTKLQEPAAKPPTLSRRSAVPFYKSDLKSGPVRNPGVVPFVWEKKPGQPKTGASPRVRLPPVPLLPPGWIPNDAGPDGSNPNSIYENKPMEDAAVMASGNLLKVTEVEDSFSEAVETLSRSESFFMNCSISGVSGIPDAFVPSGSFSTDPEVRDLMMDRFLPAAQAMVAGSPQCPPRKPAKLVETVENGEHRLRRVPLPYQHRPYFVARYPRDELDSSDGDDDGDNYEGCSGNFTSKACGLLPRLCLKNSFCLLNPMTGMKVGGRERRLPPSTSRKISSVLHDDGPLSQAENELWEAVYKHKLRLAIPLHEEGESKSTTTKSNQHGQLSDSQTLDRSSSCCHSGGSGEAFVEILKRDAKNDKSDGSESFDNDCERFCVTSTSHGSQQDSGILSPTMGNSAVVDSRLLVEIPHSKHTSTHSEKGFRSLNETSESAYVVSEVIADNQRMEENPGSERHNVFVLQPQSSGIHDSDLILHSARNQIVGSLPLEVEEQSKINSNFHFLLPPPLPKTPSESWLLRTLPSVSAKSSSGQSIFGVHTMQRKQGFYASSTPPRQESDAKPLELQHQQVPCDVAPTEQSKESSIKHSELQNEQMPDIKPSKPPRRQIRFADVLMTPLSPRSEM